MLFPAIPYTRNSSLSFNHNSISEDVKVVNKTKTAKTVINNTEPKVNGVKKAVEIEEIEATDDLSENGDITAHGVLPGTLIVENAVASWVVGAEPTLNDLTFRVEPGSLVAVIGAVGSGKSSLIQALLGELPLTSGKAMVAARAVSYSSQEPWIFSGTLRENVLFGRPFERRRYNQVSRPL